MTLWRNQIILVRLWSDLILRVLFSFLWPNIELLVVAWLVVLVELIFCGSIHRRIKRMVNFILFLFDRNYTDELNLSIDYSLFEFYITEIIFICFFKFCLKCIFLFSRRIVSGVDSSWAFVLILFLFHLKSFCMIIHIFVKIKTFVICDKIIVS